MKSLKDCIKDLNEAKVLEKTIKVLGKNDEKLKEEFCKSVDEVIEKHGEDKAGELLPESVVELYMSYQENEGSGEGGGDDTSGDSSGEGEGSGDAETNQEEPKGKKGGKKGGKKAAAKKDDTTKGEKKKPVPPNKYEGIPRDAFNNTEGSAAYTINQMLTQAGGATLDEIADKIGSTKSRVKSHFYYLKHRGIEVKTVVKGEGENAKTYYSVDKPKDAKE